MRMLISAALAALAISAGPPRSEIRGLNHIPTAVRDLGRASADFTRLGFVLKPGRPHADGIRNAHVKFPNGGEIELITADKRVDALTGGYVDFLKHGEGPAYWGLYAPDEAALSAALRARGLTPDNPSGLIVASGRPGLDQLFFADRGPAPSDRPEHFAHPNSAYRLQAVWLAGASPQRRLLASLAGPPTTGPACAPFAARGDVLRLTEGEEIWFLPPLSGQRPERTIVAATVLVRSLSTARAVLDRNAVRYRTRTCAPGSLWIGPAEAHGLWLELRQGG
jgi:hypothetical protein